MKPPQQSIVTVACPNPACGRPLSVDGSLAGRPSKCPHCNTPFRLPTVSQAPEPPPPKPEAPKSDLPASIGPYRISKELGRGAFGVVYRGRDEKLDRDVAIKVLNRAALSSQKAVDRFKREAKVVAGMHHSNVVPVYQFDEYEGGYYIASRFVPGKSLSDAIPENGLPAAAAVEWAAQLLEALAYAHSRGVMHRDVKPDNALLDEKGQLFLTDFGLAGWVGQAEMTQDGSVMGTPVYMSPEQARGSTREVGPAADQYGAGVVFYELLTGHRPFESGNVQIILHNVIHTPVPPPSEWKDDLDDELEAICLKALEKNPADRFTSCAEMAQALRDWQARTQPQNVLPVIEGSGPMRARPATTGGRTSQGAGRSTQAGGRSVTQSAARSSQSAKPQFVVEDEEEEEVQPASGGGGRTLLLFGGIGGGLLVLVALVGVVTYLATKPGEEAKGGKPKPQGISLKPPKDQ